MQSRRGSKNAAPTLVSPINVYFHCIIIPCYLSFSFILKCFFSLHKSGSYTIIDAAVLGKKLNNSNSKSKSEKILGLTEVKFDYKLPFDDHISELCKKASRKCMHCQE